MRSKDEITSTKTKTFIDKPSPVHCISKTSHPTTTKQTRTKRAMSRLHFIDFQK
jgi:hypothetical protein